jgi:sec-independent protein translocase protein TatA
MFSNLGSTEIIIILVVLFLLFGANKLPEIAKGLGETGKDLKKAKKEIETAINEINTNNEDEKGGDKT